MKTNLTKLRLGDVRPNPFRDIANYRLSADKVASLRASIHSTGFWPGVLIREDAGEYQLLFGHHRLEAAKQELGEDYVHDFILRDEVPDYVAIRMLADENADSWAMDVQHSILCVKQAKEYLDDLLMRGWDNSCSLIGEHELTEWFYNKGAFASAQKDGAGELSIKKFLSGAFSNGNGVRDALALIKDPVLDESVAGSFTNMAQARAFQKAVTSPNAVLAGLSTPEEQRKMADKIVEDLTPQGNSVDPKRKGKPTKVNVLERLTAGTVSSMVGAEAQARRAMPGASKKVLSEEAKRLARYEMAMENARKTADKYAGALAILVGELDTWKKTPPKSQNAVSAMLAIETARQTEARLKKAMLVFQPADPVSPGPAVIEATIIEG